jgi:hypothetical protein
MALFDRFGYHCDGKVGLTQRKSLEVALSGLQHQITETVRARKKSQTVRADAFLDQTEIIHCRNEFEANAISPAVLRSQPRSVHKNSSEKTPKILEISLPSR